MDSECSGIIGLKKLLHKLYQANPGRELFDEEKASIGRKIATKNTASDITGSSLPWMRSSGCASGRPPCRKGP
jgi:hypothetical protein